MAIIKVKGIRFIHNTETNEAPTKEFMGELNLAMNLANNTLYFKDSNESVKELKSALTYDSATYAGRQVDSIADNAQIIDICNHAYNTKAGNTTGGTEAADHQYIDVYSSTMVEAKIAAGMPTIGANKLQLSYLAPNGASTANAQHSRKVTREFDVTLPTPPAGTKYGALRVNVNHISGTAAFDIVKRPCGMKWLPTWPAHRTAFSHDPQTPNPYWNGIPDTEAAYIYLGKTGMAYLEFYVELLDVTTNEVVDDGKETVMLTVTVHNAQNMRDAGTIDSVTPLEPIPQE